MVPKKFLSTTLRTSGGGAITNKYRILWRIRVNVPCGHVVLMYCDIKIGCIVILLHSYLKRWASRYHSAVH